jgi:AcrR family transcriptional regulator
VPRPREYDDDLRLRLIEAAARLLAEEGAAAVTTRRVAAEVGTSTTAIYSLIGSKDDLVVAVREEGFARLAAHLGRVGDTGDPLDDIHRLGHAYLEMALESPDLYRIMFEAVGEIRVDAGTFQILLDSVQRCIDAGFFRGEVFTLALQLWSLTHGLAGLAIAGMVGTPEDAHRLLDESARALSAGLVQAAATPA